MFTRYGKNHDVPEPWAIDALKNRQAILIQPENPAISEPVPHITSDEM
jgi:hypothetical protein